MNLVKKVFSIIILLIFLNINAQANFVRTGKDNHKAQPGYISTVSEPNVQTLAISEGKNSRLYSIYHDGLQYCISAIKLGYSINNGAVFSSCFDSETNVGSEVIKALTSKNGDRLYLFSKHIISEYSMSPISNRVNSQISSEHIAQDIIAVEEFNNKIYVLTHEEDSNKGSLIIFTIGSDGILEKTDSSSLGYSPLGFKFYADASFDYVYVRSKEQIYKYDILNDGTINRSSKLVDYPGNTIKDFGILKDKDKKTLRMVVALKNGDSGLSQGALKLYLLNGAGVRLTSSVNLELEPYQIYAYDEKQIFLVAYEYSFDIREINAKTNAIEDKLILQRGVDGSLVNVVCNDKVTAIISDSAIKVFNGFVLSQAFYLKDKPIQLIFSSDAHFVGVANKDSVDIYEITAAFDRQ
ncbi:hypothetical protein [Francisella philomiragia]|uniref:hypothetical protein n=1 Tax=Francisella philomiragia TaxID=28110 RepID=UPI001902F0A8|nr:hypothetical protein [Francisella philomiragia]MBK2093408.1 hypothetical protein [Francisella philomiragia]MBK2255878.1 hypothetical protein [Francisella philomiragia]MBK2268536.1 hypothetical protein [Francisella philomiragia]MBK2270989.1 hypothetical protein [Francisella philomiragia]MBK2274769.1 hypothetical protein [Francisella philomiragia]